MAPRAASKPTQPSADPSASAAAAIVSGRTLEDAQIAKPDTDRRLYRRIELTNGLVALLISDPNMSAVDSGKRSSRFFLPTAAVGQLLTLKPPFHLLS